MPAENVSITANYTAIDYTVTVDGVNGTQSATSPGGNFNVGETVTLSATPETGYAFNGWTVNSGGVTITNDSFTMPAEDVSITANYFAFNSNDFTNYLASYDNNVVNFYGNIGGFAGLVAYNSAGKMAWIPAFIYAVNNEVVAGMGGGQSGTTFLSNVDVNSDGAIDDANNWEYSGFQSPEVLYYPGTSSYINVEYDLGVTTQQLQTIDLLIWYPYPAYSSDPTYTKVVTSYSENISDYFNSGGRPGIVERYIDSTINVPGVGGIFHRLKLQWYNITYNNTPFQFSIFATDTTGRMSWIKIKGIAGPPQ